MDGMGWMDGNLCVGLFFEYRFTVQIRKQGYQSHRNLVHPCCFAVSPSRALLPWGCANGHCVERNLLVVISDMISFTFSSKNFFVEKQNKVDKVVPGGATRPP